MSMGAGTSKPSIPDRDDEELLQNIGWPLNARNFGMGSNSDTGIQKRMRQLGRWLCAD